MIEDLVLAWVRGWAVSRRTAPPVLLDGAYRVDVGLPGHLVRYVVPGLDARVVRRLTGLRHVPGTWVKICAEPARAAPLLPDGWSVQESTEYLMAVPLRQDAPRTVPEGYALHVSTADGIVTVAVRTADGEPAATGRAGLADAYAVFDQIETAPAHRRRGLGGAVMSALSAAATAQGADTGVLVATAEGRALYRHLGWQEISEVTAAHVPA
ncbi:GNAT family N-acetyltransferase [Actinomadura macrotermitis]|uniref:N-acetyltransferase domain-containing protein n=1 Tax=Actinomadura macrotermitis TaxID=2585200 RepID=A0A7K0C5R2_9ACTN|nr:GNAT family N-acetyltransferase [Actinomadura macrotermitis]MQY08164.1 hypothetical protein [Actinomadura macrotermitis]